MEPKGKSNERPRIVKSYDFAANREYVQWICDLKRRYRNAQIKASVKINSEQLLFNWQLGRDLAKRSSDEKWGKRVVEQVSLDLQAEFPGADGFSVRNLQFMKQWYLFYASGEEAVELIKGFESSVNAGSEKLKQVASLIREGKTKQAASQFPERKANQAGSQMPFPPVFAYVPWMHHVLIVQKCKTIAEALFYIRRTIEKGLSRSALDNSIRADTYHCLGAAVTNFKETLPLPQGLLAQELLKDNYDFGFIALPEEYDEAALEDAIEDRMTRFLLELGAGWAFLGRQKEIIIAGKTRKIDLLFYHIYLRCYVVLELKVKPFDPEFAGKLNFYVNAVNQFVKREDDNPTIGLLICKDMDRTEVQLAFQGVTTPMGVATYDNVGMEEIQKHLPTARQIQRQVEIAEEEYKAKLQNKENK